MLPLKVNLILQKIFGDVLQDILCREKYFQQFRAECNAVIIRFLKNLTNDLHLENNSLGSCTKTFSEAF